MGLPRRPADTTRPPPGPALGPSSTTWSAAASTAGCRSSTHTEVPLRINSSRTRSSELTSSAGQPAAGYWSRTRFLLKDFAASFGSADFVVVPDIYFVRDSESEKANISSRDLVDHIRANGGQATYLGKFGQIVRHLKSKLEPGDLVITMGAGKVWEIADEIVHWLGSNSQT